MKVAVLHAPLDLRLDEVAVPEIGPDDLLVNLCRNLRNRPAFSAHAAAIRR